MFIQTEATPNPATLEVPAGPRGAGERHARLARASADAAQSPLAERLFGDPGRQRRVLRLRFHHRDQERRRMAAAQADDPRRHHGAFHVGRAAAQRRRRPRTSDGEEFFDEADAETVATIKELIETRVRPAVANDGGDITFRGFKDGIVYLNMKGACSGCPSSTATLRHGIQNLLRHFVPDVTEVRPM